MLSDASQSQKDKPWVAHSRGPGERSRASVSWGRGLSVGRWDSLGTSAQQRGRANATELYALGGGCDRSCYLCFATKTEENPKMNRHVCGLIQLCLPHAGRPWG